MIQANQSVLTDLSKLGKPGQHFVHDFFLPGTQLTFPVSQTKRIAALAGVSEVSNGLLLLADHQEGTVPKIVATFKTGGQSQTVSGQPQAADERRAGADAGLLREGSRPAGRKQPAAPPAAARAAAERAASARAAAAGGRRARLRCVRAVHAGPAPALPRHLPDAVADAAPGARAAADEHHEHARTRSAASTRRSPTSASSRRRR